MTRFSDQGLLDLWERVETAPPAMRPAELLEGLRRWVGEAADEPAWTLPIGRRDRALIDLRARVFGPEMSCATDCAHCGERIELTFDLGALPTASSRDTASLVVGDIDLRLRLPSTLDVSDVLGLPDPARPAALVHLCALDPLPDALSPALIEAASAAMAEADPDADIELGTTCPGCGTQQALTFDIGHCLWDDLSRAARRLIREVHHLATAYGWSEAEVLAVPRRRRREYLLVGST